MKEKIGVATGGLAKFVCDFACLFIMLQLVKVVYDMGYKGINISKQEAYILILSSSIVIILNIIVKSIIYADSKRY